MATTPLRLVGPSFLDTSEFTVSVGAPAIETTIKPPGAAASYRFNAAGAPVAGSVQDFGPTTGFANWNKANFAARVWFYYGGTPPSATSRIFEFRNQTALPACGFRITSAGGSQLIYWNGANTLTVLQTRGGLATGWHYWDLKVTAAATGGSSVVEGALDGVAYTSGSSLTLTNAVSNIATIQWGVVSGVTFDLYLSQLTVTDGDYTTGGIIKTAIVTGAGSQTTGWAGGTGSTFAEVDENPRDNDTTYIKSAASGDARTFALQDASAAGINGDILAVQPIGFFASDAGVATSHSLRLRSDTTNSDTTPGDALAIAPTYTITGKCVVLDPATAAAWTESGFNAAEIGAVNSAAVGVRCSALLVAVLASGHVRATAALTGSLSVAAALGTRFAIASALTGSLSLAAAMGTRFAVEAAAPMSLSLAAVAGTRFAVASALPMTLSVAAEMGTRYSIAAALTMNLSLAGIILEANPYQRYLPPPGRGVGAALLRGGRGPGATLLPPGRGTIAGAPQPGR